MVWEQRKQEVWSWDDVGVQDREHSDLWVACPPAGRLSRLRNAAEQLKPSAIVPSFPPTTRLVYTRISARRHPSTITRAPATFVLLSYPRIGTKSSIAALHAILRASTIPPPPPTCDCCSHAVDSSIVLCTALPPRHFELEHHNLRKPVHASPQQPARPVRLC